MITIQKYVRAASLEEAYQLNQNRANKVLGGMLWLRLGRGSVHTAIDLCDLGLDAIEETEDAFRIGAMATLRDMEMHEGLHAYTNGALREALRHIVGVQFRHMATVGGSIWGRFGFSDVLTVFLAMDAYVELYRGGVIPLAQFAQMPYDRDILVRVIVKKTPGRFAYGSMRNQRTDFPVIACCAACVAGAYRVSIGARPGRAVLLGDEEKLLDGGVTRESARAFAAYAAEHTPTQGNARASAQYRTHLIRVLVERAVLNMAGVQEDM